MTSHINRREFLKKSTIAGVGLSFGGWMSLQPGQAMAAAALANANVLKMNITPIAIADDCARLAIYSHATSKPYQQALAQNWDAMRIGGVWRHGEKQIAELLIRARNGMNHENIDPKAARNAAFVSGWLFHRAANTELYGKTTKEGDDIERMIYHDVNVLREMSLAEHDEKIDAHPPKLTVDDMHHLLLALKQRTELRLHTFNPDERNGATENWVFKLGKWDKDYRLLLAQHAEAMVSPDSQKVKKYLESPVFYDRTDATIHCARGLQAGLQEPIDVVQAVAASKSQSQYARVLAKGYEAAMAVSAFLSGEIDDGVLKTKLFRA